MSEGTPLAGFRIGVTATRKADEQGALLARRGAEIVYAPALSLDPNRIDPADLRASTEEVIGSPVDVFLVTTGIGLRGWFDAAESWGLLEPLLERLKGAEILARGPKSVGALRARGLRELWAPESEEFDDVMAHNPDGVFLSKGPGDPAATGEYAVPVIQELLKVGKPIFGICLGHQLLGLAVGAKTAKMHQGHRGANHPVKRTDDGRVEITSMNHGFAVLTETLPANAEPTHISLFDGSLAGLRLTDKPAFSVQYHPEASPGPQDSHYLFEQFVSQLRSAQ